MSDIFFTIIAAILGFFGICLFLAFIVLAGVMTAEDRRNEYEDTQR